MRKAAGTRGRPKALPKEGVRVESMEESEDIDHPESDEEMGEEELTGIAAKMVRQAKFMKQRLGMEDDEDEDEEEKQQAIWGRGKKIYYGADNVDYELQSSDEEAPAEEEEAARQLQQETAASLRPEDYEVDDDESDENEADREEALEEAAEREEHQVKKQKKTVDKVVPDDAMVTIEQVKKDMTALSRAEQIELLMSDAPELVGLTTELGENLNELRTKVQPLLEKVKGGNGATEEGITYLELKHMLLLSYCQAIVFYLMLKAEARSVRDHPVVGRLVELKLSLERIRPIEQNLQKQIERLLDADLNGATENGSSVKEGDGSSEASRKLRTERKKSKKRKSSLVESANGVNGRAEELENVLGTKSKEMLQERTRLDARVQGGERVANIPLSNAERRKVKRQKSSIGLTRMADDLEDDVENEATELRKVGGILNGKPRTLSQVIAQAGRPFKHPQIISGDADLPVRDDLGEKRRKLEIQKTNMVSTVNENDDIDKEAGDMEPEEDDFYKQARLLKEAKEAAKLAKYSRTLVVPVEEEDAEGKRHITYQMEKNRGLTPHRKKAHKNPRKKYKLKHEKAVIRRKGQVRDVRAPTSNYGGESTGIRTNISRSVRFQN